MLSAIKLLSLNPWVVVGVLVTLAAAFGGTFVYGVRVGGTAAELACEKRVAAIMREIDRKNAEIDAANARWQSLIDKVTEAYNERVASEERNNDELEKRISEYESQLNAECPIDQSDIDSVRGK